MDFFVTVNRADYHGNYDAGLISVGEKGKDVKAGFFHFSRRWITHLVTHRKIRNQTLSGETVRMCRLAWSFAARICDKYLNHMNWY